MPAEGTGEASSEPKPAQDPLPPPRSLREAARSAVMSAERQMIQKALERTAWNRKKAAKELGVSYRSLLYKIKDYTLRKDRPGERTEPLG